MNFEIKDLVILCDAWARRVEMLGSLNTYNLSATEAADQTRRYEEAKQSLRRCQQAYQEAHEAAK